MSMTHSSWIYVVFCTILLQGLMCEAGVNVTQCPSFQENVANTVEALTNNTAINEETNCIGNVKTLIEFLVITASGIPTYLCRYNFGTCTISSALDASKCGCNSGTGSIFTYTLQFNATKTNDEGGEIQFRSNCQRPLGFYLIKDSCPIKFITTTASPTTTGSITTTGPEETRDYRLLSLLLLFLLLLPVPIPLPWPGYPIYVVLCRIPNQGSSTGSPRPGWHEHYMCGRRTNDVYFSAFFVTNNGRAVLIWSRSPTTRQFVWYGIETTSGTNSSGAGHAMAAPPSHRNNVSPASGAVNNGNERTRQKEKNKHTGTDGSPRKPSHPDAPVKLTTVRTSSPPQAATVHGDNQASGTPHGDHQASGTPRLRPLPERSRMASVERNSSAETSNMLGRDQQPKLPPINPDNRP